MEEEKKIVCKNCNCEVAVERNRDLIRKKYCSNKCKYESMSKAYKGKIFSEEHKKHLKENHRLKNGYSPTWLGKKMPEEMISKIAASNKISQKGKILTEEHKQKIREWNQLYNIWKGRKHSEESKNKIKSARKNWIIPMKDTKIEKKIQRFLMRLGINYFAHRYMNEITHAYQCDIFIPSMNKVIECDGDYWHSYPTGKEIDHIRTNELIEKGFKVLRLWECEIKSMDINSFKNKLNKES